MTAPAIWLITGTTAIQVVTGTLTGTGLMHLTNGVIDSAAWPFEVAPSSDQILVTNHAGTDTAAITAAGDLAYASGSFTVTGLQGRPVASTAPGNGYALTWNSGAGQWQPQSVSITQPTGTGLWWEASGSLNAAAVSLTGDVSQGALSGSNVPLEVTGLLNKALASLPGSQQYLGYSGAAWNFTTPSGIVSLGLTWADDLSTSTTSAQWVSSIGGASGGGGAVPLNAGAYIRGASGATIAAFRNHANSADVTALASDASDNLLIDTTAAVQLGLTNATAVNFGNLTHTASIGHNLTSSGSETWAFNGTTCMTLNVNALFSGTGGGLISNGTSGNPWSALYTSAARLLVSSSNPELLFLDGGVSGASNGGVIGWAAANASGSGMPLAAYSQGAKSGSNANSGPVQLVSGALDGSGSDGGIQFGFNVNTGGSIVDQIIFAGANTSAARGTMQWSKAITPQLTQATASTGANPINFTVSPQGPSASSTTQATNTPGSFVVSIAAVGTNTVSGLHGVLAVNDNSNTQFWAGSYRSVSSGVNSGVSAVWVGQGDSGFTPNVNNYAIANFAGTIVFNAPSGGGVEFDVGNATTYLYLTGGLINCYQPVGGSSGSSLPFAFNASASVSIAGGGTVTLTAAQYSCPIIYLTGSPSSACTVVFPNQLGFYLVDVSQCTLNSTDTLSFKNAGGATSVAYAQAVSSSNQIFIVIVNPRGANTISVAMF